MVQNPKIHVYYFHPGPSKASNRYENTCAFVTVINSEMKYKVIKTARNLPQHAVRLSQSKIIMTYALWIGTV